MNKGRIISIALVISISINMLFIGAVIGRVMMHRGPDGMRQPFGWAVRNLDPETRQRIRPQLRQFAMISRPMRNEMRAAREDFNQLLAAEEIDEATLGLALARIRDTTLRYQTSRHEQMIALLKEFKPEQRRQVARFLMRPPHGASHGASHDGRKRQK